MAPLRFSENYQRNIERISSKVLRKSWRFLEYDWAANWQQIMAQSFTEYLRGIGSGEFWSGSENHRKVSRVRTPIIHDLPQIDTMKHYMTQSDTIIIVLTPRIQLIHDRVISKQYYYNQ